MKVLIITYYWPPAGGSGVQRWLKFVKYLKEFGVNPVVYTVENPDYALEDESLLKDIPEGLEVVRHPIWEPYKLANLFSKGKAKQTSAGFMSSKQTLFGKLSTYIRANFFIPDARKFWIKPSILFLTTYLKNNPVDAIISTGPPHSTHMIGLGLQEKLGLKWVADFRDPWTQIDYFHQLPLTKRGLKKHHQKEAKVLSKADLVLVVGATMREMMKKHNNTIEVLTNGYDGNTIQNQVVVDSKFSITHIGLMNEARNPYSLWKVLSELCTEIPDFSKDLELKLIGKVDPIVQKAIADEGLIEFTNELGYLPHEQVHQYQQSSQILLLAVNKVPSAKGIITGKIFEYLLAKRPIVAVGPTDGDLSVILEETNAGEIFDFDAREPLKAHIVHLYERYKKNELEVDSKQIEKYHRKELTSNLVNLLKKL
ncbi:MAG: glycosyltransferase family 4 protein [Flavicella sp.]